VYLGRGFQLLMPSGGTFIVGAGVEFRRDFVCEIQGDGRVVIGDRAVFTYGCVIQCSTSVEVGEGAMIGQHCQIVDGNHRFRDPDVAFLDQGYDFRPIRIGPQAAILSKCTIIADVGERAVVAAHSVVTENVPAYSLAGGVPARVIEYYGPDAGVAD
jgi:acetyltransferase-like isoleucine patch superfamily enzyme